MEQSISMKKAAMSIAGAVIAVAGIGIVVGYTFFWDQYNTASSGEKKAAALTEKTAVDPKDEESRLKLAWAYYEQEDYELAKEQFTGLLEQNADNRAASYGLAAILNEEKQYAEAEKLLLAVNEAVAEDAQVLHELGIAQREQEKYTEAEKAFRHALQIEPLSADLHYDMALLYEKMKDQETAIVHYKKSIDLVPDFAASLAGLKRLGVESYEPKKFH